MCPPKHSVIRWYPKITWNRENNEVEEETGLGLKLCGKQLFQNGKLTLVNCPVTTKYFHLKLILPLLIQVRN